ncbi:MAG TPA: hypothetical protein EYN28_08420 [Flavobacteriales bacterium]|jgi:hypothetical protein|nr:hypothetical protein [Flavobacteriales bacterium]HIB77087.1 hypothetical protein [Flavobacteriales bacterium]HIN41015.1 hypothetical protein [Flavobacteriales bacterium]HIO15263.1 hypothetical protein [Flavobacteriales bacterium]HIO60184.1 hypothetical protein [Flavobacteriales bacterium]
MKSNLRILLILVVITAITGVIWQFQDSKGDLSTNVQADFAIADTSLVDKIFIVDTNGRSALLERSDDTRFWTLNGEFLARKDATDLLLKTFTRVLVKGPVAELQRETVLRNLSGSGKKVEIYQGGDLPVKTWYIGTPTQSHTGTFVLLETAELGKSSEPFIVHLKGSVGFISTRFFTDVNEWRYTGVFDFPGRSLAEVTVTHHDTPSQSYKISSNINGVISLENGAGALMSFHDTLKVQNRFLRFRKVHFESFNSHLSEEAQNKIKNSSPAFTMIVKGFDGRSSKFDLFWKESGNSQFDGHDGEHMYGLTSDGEVVLVQRYVFDPLTEVLMNF